jgi:ATP adenylyltransferase
VSHKQLWAPWRLSYIKTTPPGEKPQSSHPDCFLCGYRDSDADSENLVVHRGSHAIVVLNRFPYNNGHLLIAPAEHKADIRELTDDEMLDCGRLLQKMVGVLEKAVTPDGFNIGLNLGRVAGAGLPGHLHWHIVPRWNGDTNFMPVLGDAKVIPQSLDALYEILEQELSSLGDNA